MAIDSTHPAYDRYLDRWQRCRHAAEGSDTIKEEGTKYLPKLSGQDNTEYEAYKMRALWYGATSRTIQGLRGAVMRKDPTWEFPEQIDALLNNLTDDNMDIVTFAAEVVTELLTPGRCGLLADMPQEQGKDPYVTRYAAENIINWRTEMVDGREKLTLVVLQEKVEEDGKDEFEVEEKIRYRVLRIEGGVYQQEEWGAESKTPEKVIEPKRLGQRLDFIPFRFVNAASIATAPERPPLIDVVDVNLSHYRTSADLEHGAHFTALPTPWLAGFPVENTFAIGSGVAFVTDNYQARAGMLEFTGKGLDTLVGIKESKEKLMAVLGARLLEEQKKGVEASETLRLRSTGESSALSALAMNASRAIADVLQWCAWWKGAVISLVAASDVVKFQLNTDFVNDRLGAQEITALLGALQGGAISMKTWLYNLERGEILPPDTDVEEEIDMINVEAGALDIDGAAQDLPVEDAA